MSAKKQIPIDLLIIIFLSLLTTVFVLDTLLQDNPIKIFLGLFMVLFIPGYALVSALFPEVESLDIAERLALSFGLSLAVAALSGLALYFTSWGTTFESVLVVLVYFTVLISLVAAFRRQKAGVAAFSVYISDFTGFKSEFISRPESRLDKIVTIILVLSILVSAITLAYVIFTPKQGEEFTEFYILGPDGKADNYTTQLVAGEKLNVILGIVNHEYSKTDYSVVIKLDNYTVESPDSLNHVVLDDGATWQESVSFIPSVTGTNMKLQYLLYKDSNFTEPYRDLHLWINVTGSE